MDDLAIHKQGNQKGLGEGRASDKGGDVEGMRMKVYADEIPWNGILALLGIISILVIMWWGVPTMNEYQAQNAAAQAAYNAKILHLNGTVTYANQWQSQACAWYGGCWTLQHENITITIAHEPNLTESYTCTYFKVGQSVAVWKYPSYYLPIWNGTKYIQGQQIFQYRVQGVPSGC